MAKLLKLGIDIAERTLSRLMPKRRSAPSQTWRTFPFDLLPPWLPSSTLVCFGT
jgi:hypothetical protein